MDIKNLAIVRQSFANAVFTHKVQEVAAEFSGRKAVKIKVANIAITSLTLIMLLLQVASPSIPVFTYIGAGIAAGEIIFLIFQLTFDFDQIAVTHKNSALKYMQLRDKYRALIADIINDVLSSDTLIARRDALQAEYQIISDLAPQTGGGEYIEAQKRLNTAGAAGSEQFTWSDSEIDQFLPQNLRLQSS